MSDETNNNGGPTAAPEPGEPKGFNEQEWLILVGLRQRQETDPPSANPFSNGIVVGMAVTPEAVVPTPQGDRADKTIPSVHFAHWLDRNWGSLLRLWEVEYTQYRNMAMRSQPAAPTLRLVGADGERLQ